MAAYLLAGVVYPCGELEYGRGKMALILQAASGPHPNVGYYIACKYIIAAIAYAKLLTKVLASSIFERKTAILL